MVRACWRERIPVYASRFEIWGDLDDEQGYVTIAHCLAEDLPHACERLIADIALDVIKSQGFPLTWGSEVFPEQGLSFHLTPRSTWTKAQVTEVEAGYKWYRKRQIGFSGL